MIINTVVNNYLFGPESDPQFSSTVLLLSGDGTNGSQVFTDESFANRGVGSVTGASNDVQVQTSFKKYGTGSIRHDGSADVIRYSDHADWNFGSADFTIELWAAFSNLGSYIDNNEQSLIGQWAGTSNQRSFLIQYRGDLATNAIRLAGSSNGTATDLSVQGDWTPTEAQFYHLCVDRSGNDFRFYIDGAMLVKVTQAFTFFDASTSLRIGARENGGAELGFFRGNLDEIRITKGVARYASDGGFSVPTAAFPRS